MLCKCHWILLYTVHFTAFCLGGRFFPDTVYYCFSGEMSELAASNVDFVPTSLIHCPQIISDFKADAHRVRLCGLTRLFHLRTVVDFLQNDW